MKIGETQRILKLHCATCRMLSQVGTYVKTKVKQIRQGGAISCLYLTILCLVPLVGIAIFLRVHMSNAEYYTIYIDTQDEASYVVNEYYLSLGLDSTIITDGFRHFNMSDINLIKMIKHLSPAYLRVGGNQADQIVFSKTEDSLIENTSDAYVLTASDWTKLYHLSKEANVTIIYDLNSLLRYDNGTWCSENAREMLEFSQENNFSVNWELGNEPNSYPKKFNALVNASQLGTDYIFLRELLNTYPLYTNSSLIGPSVTRLSTKYIEEYLLKFLEAGYKAITAMTFHQYYFSGVNVTWEEFIDPENFDYLESCINAVKSVTSLIEDFDKPIWLGETATAWHGGAPDMSDRFLGSFLWIDKLGLSAKMAIDVVVRQSIFKGDYALINNTYYPNPDWWLSVLYKKLVGRKVITTKSEGNAKIRLYAHCAKYNELWKDGATVVVFGVNINDYKGLVQVKELHSGSEIYSYSLKANDTLFSQFVQLNGKLLELDSNMDLPTFQPNVVHRQDIMEIDPMSIIFWVFTNTDVNVCSS
ncbi:heparanase-like [Euwallacea fornicatus]|uniref:heparanase-like n=1 Tax=Euwallacea fornicatus TaxID=995702 RepID=UPI00338F8946